MSLNFPDEPNDGDIFQGYVYNATRNVWDIKLPSDNNIEDLNNVSLTSPANGQALVYNTTSSNWVNQNQTFNGLTDTSFASPVTGDSLIYNGTSWVNGPRSGNAIINGDFGVWQRGTTITQSTSTGAYTADRFRIGLVDDGVAWLSSTTSRSTNVPANTGIEYSAKITANATTGNGVVVEQPIENSAGLTGTVTASFYIRRIATFTENTPLNIYNSVVVSNINSLSTSTFTRLTRTFTASNLQTNFSFLTVGNRLVGGTEIVSSTGDLFEVTGFQIEAGPVATPFRLAGGGSKAAELALCKRYYQKLSHVIGTTLTANQIAAGTMLPVEMRITPLITATGPLNFQADGFTTNAVQSSFSLVNTFSTPESIYAIFGNYSGLTAGRTGIIAVPGNNSNVILLDSEL